MTRIIAIAMQKGGTGKTTTAINLASGLARGIGGDRLRKVLLVDADPQANATAVYLSPEFTLGPAQDAATTYEVMVHQIPPARAIQTVELLENERGGYAESTLDLLPAHIRLARAEIELLGVIRREDRLAAALREVGAAYEYIIIDCPPSLGILTLNALMAASEVIIPVEPGFFPLIGIGLLQQTIADVAEINGLRLTGAIPTIQGRTVEARETLEMLEGMFGELVLPAIPERVAIRNAHAARMDIFAFATDAASSDAAIAYANLVTEVAHAKT